MAKASTKGAAPAATPRKSSRISEAKRKATDDVSPAQKKRKAADAKAPEASEASEAFVKPKKAKVAETAETQKEKAAPAPKAKKGKKAVVAEEDKENAEIEVEDDATTEALVAEIDAEEDKEPAGGASLYKRGQDVGKAPAAAVKKAAQVQDANQTAVATTVATTGDEATAGDEQQYGGIVYVGRIPHGFFENEMRSYFSQFGTIRRLRLSRNRKTGASKHYAFIEFADRDVAEIVAKTMDNYLLFGHILRCSVVSNERVPPNLFKGANRRFKAVPWNLMSGRRMAQPKPEDAWTSKIGREQKRRAGRAAALESKLGYTFAAPALKTTEAVEAETTEIETPKTETPKAVEPAETKAIETPKIETPETKPVEKATTAKGKKAKGKKAKA